MSNCNIPGCDGSVVARGWCGKHYSAWRSHGDPLSGRSYAKRGTANKGSTYKAKIEDRKQRFEHVLVAERAIGKRLPAGAIVHHVDENPRNNANSNLVICPDQKYHMLLHKRARAIDACGNANWHPCQFCKQYDAPENLYVSKTGNSIFHRKCHSAYERNRQQHREAA